MERRLAAILAADVVGFSSLTEADEEDTVQRLHLCRDMVEGLVAAHGGRVFGGAGDSVVAEFPSPVEAVRCAVDVQERLQADNADLPDDRRMQLRIGVNLADVVVDGAELFGAGVNIAARLEALADAGGVFLSHTVLEQVRAQLPYGYEDLGEHIVKNIAEPLRVYRLLRAPAKAGEVVGAPRPAKRSRKTAAFAGILVFFFAVAAGIAWQRQQQPSVQPAAVEKLAFPLPDRPSIVVLPFANLGGEEESGMALGLTEDITTMLSQLAGLFVIARESADVFDDSAALPHQVAETLGVRYVLSGSLQQEGDSLRVHAKLIDALSGQQLWAERYEREAGEIFALQDEIADRVVVALRVELTEGEEARAQRRHTRSLAAWRLLSQGKALSQRANREDNALARRFFEDAIAVDRDYALAYALLASTYWQDAFHQWSPGRNAAFRQAAALGAQAAALDDSLPEVHALQGVLHLSRREFEAALAAADKAVNLDPNHATNRALKALILHNAGRPQEAIDLYKSAMRLSPYYPAWFLEDLGFAYLAAGAPGESLAAFDAFLAREPAAVHRAHAHVGRALALHATNRPDAARREIALAVEADPDISLTGLRQLSLSRERERLDAGLGVLRELGLKE